MLFVVDSQQGKNEVWAQSHRYWPCLCLSLYSGLGVGEYGQTTVVALGNTLVLYQ